MLAAKSERNSFFYAVLVTVLALITLAAIELVSFIYLYIETGQWDSKKEIQATLHKSAKSQQTIKKVSAKDRSYVGMRDHILHPYLGFVRNFDVELHRFNGFIVDEPVNRYGFFGPDPVTDASDNDYVIAILGGSVALEFYLFGSERLEKILVESGFSKNKNIKFISIALGGMKQPQQLMALAYFLSLGSHFDAVINIDGFNEVVLPLAENKGFGVNPFYPRSWRLYSTKSIDAMTTVLTGEIYAVLKELNRWSRRLGKLPFRESYTVLSFWRLYHESLTNRRLKLEEKLSQHLQSNPLLSAQESGPPYNYDSNSHLMSDLASVWQLSSEQLWALCKSNSIKYFHFLQPNQYFPGTRTSTDWEKRHTLKGKSYSYRQGAEQGYSYLAAAGMDLQASDVPFTDASRIFQNEPRSVYKDVCCHYNQLGNEILAEHIAEVMARSNQME